MLHSMAGEVTILLHRYKSGDADALNDLTELLYPQLKAMARRRTYSNERMNATVLVNETFVKLLSGGELSSADRAQFFGLAAAVMRQVIVDEVRYVTAQKRAGQPQTFSDSQTADESKEQAEFLLLVDQCVEQLAQEDPRLAQVFECRYFAGYSTSETALAVDISPRSVERLWSTARARIADLIDDKAK